MSPEGGTIRRNDDPRQVRVEMFADVICPWCYIGKRRLEAAFEARPEITPVYVWRAFLLNPTMPPQGMDRQAYLLAKFGASSAAVYGRIAEAGLDSGIAFDFDRIKRTPCSRMAQRMIIAAGREGIRLAETLFRAYFLEGRDIGSEVELRRIAEEFGKPELIDEALNEQSAMQMETDLGAAQDMRLDGVPCFTFDATYAVSGAHLPEHIIPAIDAAAAAAR